MYIYDYLKDTIIKDNFGLTGSSIVITKEDKYLLVPNGLASNNNISIYDIRKNEVIDSLSSIFGKVHSFALSPDDKYLSIGTGKSKIVNPDPENPGYEEERMFDKIVIIDLATKEIIKEFDGPYGTEGKIQDIKFSPDGNYLGVAKLDGSVRVYDMFSLELYINENIGYGYSSESGPWKVSFTKDSKNILCGIFGYDFFTRIFDIEKNELVKTLNIFSFTGLDASTKDSILISSSGQITLLKTNILTEVKDNLENKIDTLSLTIFKTKNPIYEFNCIEIIKNMKLFNYSGQELNIDRILQANNEKLRIDAEILDKGVYFLVINDKNKPIKILVIE